VSRKTAAVVIVAVIVGAVIGYVDSRPNWDDTAVTAGAVLLAAIVLASIRPGAAWLIGLALGLPVVVFNVVTRRNWASVLAIGFSMVGAGIGYGISRIAGLDAHKKERRRAR